MPNPRQLLVIADDFGIGPNTTQGILELGSRGVLSGSVLLVNSPFAESAVESWKRANQPMELGWHANLTLDQPILAPTKIPSLVSRQGRFWSLRQFVKLLALGRINPAEIRAELTAQLDRFRQLVGTAPHLVNCHHHVAVFAPVGTILLDILSEQNLLPYVRRVQEPWYTLARIGGTRSKRLLLNWWGRRFALEQERRGFPGNQWLAGIANPQCFKDPLFFSRWLQHISGQVVEMVCHPGHPDKTLVGRDCLRECDGMIQWRADEWKILSDPSFPEAIRQSGWTLTTPGKLLHPGEGVSHAA